MLGIAVVKSKSATSGDDTKARIIGATLDTLKEAGIVGTSARAIARAGDFNQALIFYHFGSVDDAVMAAVADLGSRRIANHKARLEAAASLPDLIRIARQLHEEDTLTDNMAVLVQAFAGAVGNGEMGPKLYAALEPWSQLVADTIERLCSEAPGGQTLPHRQIADAISALFLGIELLDDLDRSRGHADMMFDSLDSLAELLDRLLATPLLGFLSPNP